MGLLCKQGRGASNDRSHPAAGPRRKARLQLVAAPFEEFEEIPIDVRSAAGARSKVFAALLGKTVQHHSLLRVAAVLRPLARARVVPVNKPDQRM